MAPDDSAARIPLGPVGGYVIENLKELRRVRGLTYKELADLLEDLGRPIPTLGLSRIEKGNRRVDADDLVALAIALGVSPTALLLPRNAGPGEAIELTPEGGPVTAQAAWVWADGKYPLVGRGEVTWREIADFESHARPVWHEGGTLTQWRDEAKRFGAEMEELRTAAPQPVVAAIVTSAKGVLVTRRRDGKPLWGFVTGEIEPGELAEDAAVREVKEETALEVRTRQRIGERDHPRTGRHMIYLAAKPVRGSTKVIVGDESELAEVRWASVAEALELMTDMFGPVREYLAAELGSAQ
jgi:8-oxo-dGTP pyrophosphatase MutT (NUDIX family)/transcriptional regulator with XRE-family HTH domain